MTFRSRWAAVPMLLSALGLSVVLSGASRDRPEPRTILTRLQDRFPEADTDKDGALSPEEVQALRTLIRLARDQVQAATAPKAEAPKPTAADVSYGPYPRNVLDFYQAESDEPTPVIVYIHGGGFVGGDKKSVDGNLIQWAHRDGISVAAIHYRFVTTDPFPAPQHDAARAIQFLRSKAADWNIDPERIAAYGGSAGAGLSMWLGFHDDLADPESDDPVERQSTRLKAVGSIGGQSTYDPRKIRELIGGRAWQHPSLVKCYGLKSLDEVDDPALQPAYDEASAITHLTPDDPPVFMIYSDPDQPLPANAGPGVGIHHPRFGHLLKERMDELGIESVYRHRDDGAGDDLRRLLYEFLRDHLVKDATTS